MDVDTRVLRYFTAVAEELNFTRAAERLFLSQPALSRQIRQLENELRTQLFERTGREVRLTAAGEALLPAARALVADWQSALRTTRAVAAAGARILRIGFVATGAGQLITQARTDFTEHRPDVSIEPKRYDWGGEVPALREGLVDLAFIWLPAETDGLHTEIVAVERRMVGLNVDHHLAGLNSVSIGDLADEPLVWTRKASRRWVDWWAVNPRPDGREPIWGPENDNVEEMLEHVAAGVAICIGPKSMAAYYSRPDLIWLPITDISPLRIALGWPEHTRNRLVTDFAAVVRRLSEHARSPAGPPGDASGGTSGDAPAGRRAAHH